MKEIVLLGSTGSIGKQTLDVARMHGYKIKAVAANNSVNELERQAREFSCEYACIYNEELFPRLKAALGDTKTKVLCGMDGLCELAALPCDMTVNSVVGMVGLKPTLAAVSAGNIVALANKETLVVGGELVTKAVKEKNTAIIPIDSEHSAIFQSLMGNEHNQIKRILLTASGGPFYGYNLQKLANVKKAEALSHPNWNMGDKITIDSATMMNKGLELIEAIHLFSVTAEQVEILIHRQSVIHSAVEYADGSVIAQLGVPDMRTPIQFALTYPMRYESPSERLDLLKYGQLTFGSPDEETFICLKTARKAISIGGNAPCIINCVNEAAVAAFLADRIPFIRIGELVAESLEKLDITKELDLNIIEQTEESARAFVKENI